MSISSGITFCMTSSNADETRTSIHESIGYWAGLLSRSMEAEFSQRLAPHGLTRMSYAVLGAMVFDDKTTPSGIAAFLSVDRAAVTRLLDGLEARQLIARDRGGGDKRSISIRVMPQGEILARQMQQHSHAVNQRFTEALAPEDAKRFVCLVKAMLANSGARPECGS